MPQNSADISIGVTPQSLNQVETQLGASIAKGVSKGLSTGFEKSFNTALGSMGQATRSFDSILQNTNKRVVSFGISIGLIGGAVKTFRDLVSATQSVEAAMARLGSVIPLTAKQSTQALSALFDVARKTGETFDDAAASLELFGKQGGTLETNLKKVASALQLAKVFSIDATEATKGLIVASNAYAKSGESIVSVASKLSAINRVSIASGKDVIDVFGKFGAQAEAAGVSINKLGGYIAALSARTSGGGQNIGTTLEKVFARLGNAQNIAKLQGSGIAVIDDQGQTKAGIALLDSLIGKYKDLSEAQKRTVTTVLGGSFGTQANATAALVADLTKANGLANTASQTISNATDDLASRANRQNDTLKQRIDNLGQSAKEAAAIIGNLTLAPALNNLTSLGEYATKIVKGINGDSIGAEIGKGILSGIGNVLAGPGLAVAARVAYGAVRKTLPAAIDQVSAYGGFGKGTTASSNGDIAVLKGVNVVLSQATEEEQKRYRAAITVKEQEAAILSILDAQLLRTKEINAANSALAGSIVGESRQRLGRIGGAADGYIGDAMGAESSAISRGVGGAPSSARAVYLPTFAAGGGHGIVANSSEWIAGGSIYNRDMIHKGGLPPGATPIAAGGFVANAATGRRKKFDADPLSIDDAYDAAYGGGLAQKIQGELDANAKAISFATHDLAHSLTTAAQELSKAQTEVQQTISVSLDQVRRARAAGTAGGGEPGNVLPNEGSSIRDARDQPFFPGEPLTPEQQAARNAGYASNRQAAIRLNSKTATSTGSSNRFSPNFIGPSAGAFYDSQFQQQIEQQRKVEEERRVTQIQTDAAIQRRKEENAALAERHQSLGRLANGVQIAAIGADIGAGFIPDLPGGSPGAQTAGAFRGGAQGFAIGATAGSAFGPVGTLVGAGVGFAAGAGYGYYSKQYASQTDIDRANQEQAAKAGGDSQSIQEYINLTAKIRDAQASGATPKQLGDLGLQRATAFQAIHSADYRGRVSAAGFDLTRLLEVGASHGTNTEQAALPGLALSALKRNGDSDDGTEFEGATRAEAQLFNPGTNVSGGFDKIFKTYGDYQKQTASGATSAFQDYRAGKDTKASIINQYLALLGQNSNLSKQDIAKRRGVLEGYTLPQVAALTTGISNQQRDLNTPQGTAPQLEGLPDLRGFNADVANSRASIEDQLNASSGRRQYLSQLGNARAGLATRLLGTNRVRGLGSAFDIEADQRVSDAQAFANQGNDEALGTAKDRLLGAINAPGSNIDKGRAEQLLTQINSATNSSDLRSVASSDLLDKSPEVVAQLKKVVDALDKTESRGKEQVDLAKKLNELQATEISANKYSDDFLRKLSQGSADRAGGARYIAQQTSARVGAATRILGEGRFGGQDGVDIENAYRLQATQAEGKESLRAGFDTARSGIFQELNGASSYASTNTTPGAPGVLAAINGLLDRTRNATSPSDLQSISKIAETLGVNTQKYITANDANTKQVARNNQLTADENTLRRLEVDAQRQQQLLSRGRYNASSVGAFASTASRGGINGALDASEQLDALGLLPSSRTGNRQFQLRSDSALETLRSITSQQLGRPVNGNADAVAEAARHVRDPEVGERLFNSAQSLSTNPISTVNALLNNPTSLGLSDIQSAAASGAITSGDAAMLEQATTTNSLLANIVSNTAKGGLGYGAGGSVSSTAASILAGATSGAGSGNGTTPTPKAKYSQASDTGTPTNGFTTGFSSELKKIGDQYATISDIGTASARNLQSSFESFFSSFASGAERGSDAFRKFASSVFARESSLFSNSAFDQLFGALGKGLANSGTPTPSTQSHGGTIGFAAGGTVPVMLTGGEYMFTPDQARRLGPRALSKLNGGHYAAGGLVQGGSGVVDDVPARAAPGSFVVKKSMVQRYGKGYLDSLAGGHYAQGGGVGGSPISGLGGGTSNLFTAFLNSRNRNSGTYSAADFINGADIGANPNYIGPDNPDFVPGTGGAMPGFDANISPDDQAAIFGDDSVGNVGNADGSGASAGGSSALGAAGQGLASSVIVAGLLYGLSRILAPSTSTLDYAGIQRNTAKVTADQDAYLASRPAGSNIEIVKGIDGRAESINYMGPASEYNYSNNGAPALTNVVTPTAPAPFADGGVVGGAVDPTPASSSNSGPPVQPIITIHNYGNGNVQGSAQAGGGTNSAFGGQDFADKLHGAVKQVVQEQMVEALRPAGLFSQRQRNIATPFN